jgi:hypothetical protein
LADLLEETGIDTARAIFVIIKNIPSIFIHLKNFRVIFATTG